MIVLSDGTNTKQNDQIAYITLFIKTSWLKLDMKEEDSKELSN